MLLLVHNAQQGMRPKSDGQVGLGHSCQVRKATAALIAATPDVNAPGPPDQAGGAKALHDKASPAWSGGPVVLMSGEAAVKAAVAFLSLIMAACSSA